MISIERLQVAGKIREITLTVGPGEVVALVGSRGSGKSTLIRALAGQQAIAAGSAAIGGVPVAEAAARRLCGVVGETWGFFERLSLWENMTAFAGFWGVPEARTLELVKRLDLVGQMRTRAAALTPGEMARLRLARALLHSPKALLLDEPAGDIDGESASLIGFTIEEEAEAGRAVLIVTFGYPRMLERAGRVCYLEDGRLVEPGVAPEVPPAPAASPARVAPAASSAAHVPHIAARKGERVLLFRPEEIHYAYAQEKAVYIQTPEGPCGVSFTLTDLEERLGEYGFFRCHRAYLVNVAWVKEIASWTRDSFSLILKDGKDVPLSKHRAHELRVRLNW